MPMAAQDGLLADTKAAEDPIEDVLVVDRSGDAAQVVQRSAHFRGDQLVAQRGLGDPGGLFQAAKGRADAVPAADSRGSALLPAVPPG